VEISSSVVANVYGKQSIHDLLNAPPQQPCLSTSFTNKLSKQAETNVIKPVAKQSIFPPPPSLPQDIKPPQAQSQVSYNSNTILYCCMYRFYFYFFKQLIVT